MNESEGVKATPDNLLIVIRSDVAALQAGLLTRARAAAPDTGPATLMEQGIDGLKFGECLPHDMAVGMIRLRTSDHSAVARTLAESVTYAT